jgi:FlaA1/EpsC-like NDP-sugar epimerase
MREQTLKIFEKFRNRHFILLDALSFIVSPLIAFSLRFDGLSLVEGHIDFITLIYCIVVFKFFIFWLMGVYKRVWTLASIDELSHLFSVGLVVIIIQTGLFISFRIINPYLLIPLSVVILDAVFSMLLVSFSRFSIRVFRRANEKVHLNGKGLRILIIGAGDAGNQVLLEIQKNPRLGLTPVGFIDDNPEKLNHQIRDLKVLGTREDFKRIVSDYQIRKVIVAMPKAKGEVIRDITQKCEESGIDILTVPGISDIIGGNIKINRLRTVKIEDLLRREENNAKLDLIKSMLSGKVVLVTGAGGSIGSELCRQILNVTPSKIILLGHGENSIFEIEQELLLRVIREQADEKIKTEIISKIADVKDKSACARIFDNYRPSFVFHAAAHKHVPLMEDNPLEAVWNNVIGTKNIVDLSVDYGVDRFVLISTDKAVKPSSTMGACKRIAEMITLSSSKDYNCKFATVRFGNVLGSRGSVIRTFYKQLEHGGPLTVTHPDIKRYFMTIQEAVKLVLQSLAVCKGGEVFVLDMGEPIKIVDLAKDMIRLAGLQIGTDIEIIYTGLRPGEKLFEELFNGGEIYTKTAHEKIYIARNASQFVHPDLYTWIDKFRTDSQNWTRYQVRQYFKELIPEYLNHEPEKFLHRV